MAIAIAYLFGFEIKENFNLPYLAKTPSEFWKRWHISLSSWFSEYVYIPLGGNRKGRNYINLFLVMVLSGIWHGSTMNYLIWGVCWGIISVLYKIIADILKPKMHTESRNSMISWLKTSLLFVLSALLWIPFRVDNIEDVYIILYRMFCMASGVQYVYIFIPIFLILLWIVQICAVWKFDRNNPWKPLDIQKFSSKLIILSFIIIIICFAYIGDGSFIYAQY